MTDAAPAPAPPPDHPGFGEALRVWARIGLLSFGGPAGQIALMHRVLVEEKRWISEARYMHALNYCMLLPGPEAQQLATYVGWLLHGTRGGVAAGVLFILPGFCVILALSAFYALFGGAGWIAAVFFGLKAAVLAVVVEAALRIGRRALRTRAMAALAVASFLAIFALDAPFPLIVLGAGLCGWLCARAGLGGAFAPAETAQGAGAADAALDAGLARLAPSPRRALGAILIWGGVWASAPLAYAAVFGWDSVFGPIGLFFSQMAVATFGGAYAALAYVAQQAVEAYGWLEAGEMLEGLALAETTPGPLVLVLVFVGFLAAFREATGLDPLAAGALGALLTAWVTFAPCFLWIFLGAPYAERLRGDRALAAALAAITAAVMGVMANLAIWLGLHVLFREVGVLELGPLAPPWPRVESLDPAALAIAVAAALALMRLKIGVLATLALCGGLGLALRFGLG